MLTLQPRLRKHSKNLSTDTLTTNSKRKYISVLTSTQNQSQSDRKVPIKTVGELKKMAMGHAKTKSMSEYCKRAKDSKGDGYYN